MKKCFFSCSVVSEGGVEGVVLVIAKQGSSEKHIEKIVSKGYAELEVTTITAHGQTDDTGSERIIAEWFAD